MKNQQDSSDPRTVIRGESHTLNSTQPLGFIDWFAFTVRDIPIDDLKDILINVFNLEDLPWNPVDRGWAGYEKSVILGEHGWISYGGQTQNGTINTQLRPFACRQFKNISSIIKWADQSNARITRCDIAHDDFNGEIVNIEQARKWHEDNLYTTRGRKPKPREIINHDTSIGNTFYVGKRENGKMLRIYEKGKELGDFTSPWCRAEVEYKNKDREIPWDVLKDPSHYISSAYPCLRFLSSVQCPIKTAKKAHEISYDKMKSWAKTAVGKAINAMLIHEDGDFFKVLNDIKREGIPKRLSSYSDISPLAS